jgi:hypothetical protein
MAHVVMVHGISHQFEAADSIRADWLPSLAGGVRNAGFSDIADRLAPTAAIADPFETRVAFYGALFRTPGQQGGAGGPLPIERQRLADELSLAYLRRAGQAADAELQRAASEELAALGLLEAGERQGVRELPRLLLNRLLRLPWIGRPGMQVATWWNHNLHQVTLYLTDDQVREKARRAVAELVDDRTRVIVGHSLGSIVAYEACFDLKRPLPLLVTIGSPLGMAQIVYERLRPQPPVFPPVVQRWVNVADRNDIVAAEPDLGRFFGDVPVGARFDANGRVTTGRDAHSARAYLTAVEVGRPIAEALAGGSTEL